MKCALCDDKDTLVFQVFGGHFLPLCIRNGHDCLSYSEVAARMAVENEKLREQVEKLREQIEQMRCCGNCKFEMNGCDRYACYGKDRDRRIWEIRE